MADKWMDKRPIAPHLQIWRWHPAMMSSILHRACTIISYVALVKFSIGLLFLLKTGALPLKGLIYSPLGAIGVFIGLFSLIFMALAQLRHLIWDQGKLLEPALNNTLSIVMMIISFVGALVATLLMSGVI